MFKSWKWHEQSIVLLKNALFKNKIYTLYACIVMVNIVLCANCI